MNAAGHLQQYLTARRTAIDAALLAALPSPPTCPSALADAMRQNPRMKIISVNGLYDLATPFHGAEYEFRHLALEPQIAANIRYTYYSAGHMMYIDPPSARQLKTDLASFYAGAM